MALTQITTNGIKDGTITGTDLATNVDLVDDQKLRLGTGNDLQIFHNGNHSFIEDSGTGNLFVKTSSFQLENAAGNETLISAIQDGAVELYHDNVKTFATKAGGNTLYGTDASGNVSLGRFYFKQESGTVRALYDPNAQKFQHYDNTYATFGNGDDLQIFHDGSENVINCANSHNLEIRNGSERLAEFGPNGAVDLYFDNNKKFATAGSGVDITHVAQIGTSNDQGELRIGHDGSSYRARIVSNSSNSLEIDADGPERIQMHGGVIYMRPLNSEKSAAFVANGAVELYYDNVLKLNTTSNGVTCQDDLAILDNNKITVGTGDDLQIYHDGNNSFIENAGTGSLNLYGDEVNILNKARSEFKAKFITDGAVELYHDNVKKMETSSVGVTMNDTVITNGEIRPASDNNHSIGRSNRRYITYFGVNGSINTSDKNEKNTIIDSDLGLDFINKLKPISYKWNKDDGKTHYGLIAQDLEETLTSLGKTIADFGGIYKEDDSPMGLGYSELIAPLIKAVQELSSEVAALKAA
tara:strand:- start:20 stop:1597 length:1578 start_codon:yes stop_codon:yes gene_type:complete